MDKSSDRNVKSEKQRWKSAYWGGKRWYEQIE